LDGGTEDIDFARFEGGPFVAAFFAPGFLGDTVTGASSLSGISSIVTSTGGREPASRRGISEGGAESSVFRSDAACRGAGGRFERDLGPGLDGLGAGLSRTAERRLTWATSVGSSSFGPPESLESGESSNAGTWMNRSPSPPFRIFFAPARGPPSQSDMDEWPGEATIDHGNRTRWGASAET
jgi:hypothetical protein